MKFKSLEKITRSQIDKMLYDDLERIVTDMAKEVQAEEWRKMLRDAIDRQEAQIISVKG